MSSPVDLNFAKFVIEESLRQAKEVWSADQIKSTNLDDYTAYLIDQANDIYLNNDEFRTRYDCENDYKAFNTAIMDFFYDHYFKGEEGHTDWTDEQITGSVQKDDIDNCLEIMKDTLYDFFGITEKGEN